MDNNQLKYYDEVVQVACINLYTLSKDIKKISLSNFNLKDKRHLCLLKISNLFSNLQDIELQLNKNFIIRFYLNKKFELNIKKCNNKNKIDCEEFLSHIENAYKDKEVFEKIYDEYYK